MKALSLAAMPGSSLPSVLMVLLFPVGDVDTPGLEVAPELLELPDIEVNHVGICCKQQVFVVACDGLPRPVEGAAQQQFVVDQGKFVVHQEGCLVVASHSDSCTDGQ